MPTKPIAASMSHVLRGGMSVTRLRVSMRKSTSSPSAKRVKIRVTGEISCNAAFVATNDTPHITMAVKEASLASRTGRFEVTRGCLLTYTIFTLNQTTAELSCTDVLEQISRC